MYVTNTRHQQTQIVVDFCYCTYGGARVHVPRVLVKAECWREAVDGLHIGFWQLSEELSRRERLAFKELPLSFIEQGVKCQRAFPAAAASGDNNQLVVRDV